MASILIVYGTGGGNTEIVCQKVVQTLSEFSDSEVKLVKAKIVNIEDIVASDILILASPTYGHGQLERYMEKLVNKCLKADIDLDGKKAAVIGLGNALYDSDYFLESSKILINFLIESGAEVVVEPLLVSKSPIPFLKDVVPEWTKSFLSKI